MTPGASPIRTALVTGAARGIGRATVEALAADGWRVVAGVRDPAALVPFAPAGVHVVRMDVTDPAQVRSAVAEAEDVAGGALGCVVNNAGYALFGAVEDVDPDEVRRVFATNLFGALAVTQRAMPAMRRAGRGTVVNVSTLAGRVPVPLFGVYGATKLGLAALSEALALEAADAGIRVVLLEAGVVRTELARSTVLSGEPMREGSPHAATAGRVLGALRGIREEAGLDAAGVAVAIVAALGGGPGYARVVLPDPGLRALADAVTGPDAGTLAAVRAFFGMPAPGPGGAR